MGGTAQHTDGDRRGERCAGGCTGVLAKLRRENLELKQQAGYYRALHRKAVARERRLKERVSGFAHDGPGVAATAAGTARTAEQQEREAGQERQERQWGRGGSSAAPPGPASRERVGMAGATTQQLPAQVETHELAPSERRCEQCKGELQAAGSEDSEVLEVEVRAYRRLIKRKRYRRTCQCTGALRVVTAAAPPRLIPKGILGISIWVTVLIDKYRLYRPTYRLLEALRIHGLDLALGTVTDGLKRLAPLFVPLREALRARSRTADHWHADETSWYVFEATGEDAGYRWCLWVFWCREAVVFKLDRTRSARVPKEHFAGVAGGTVSADRYCILQAVGQGHGGGDRLLLGICCGAGYVAERRLRHARHENLPILRNISFCVHIAFRNAISPLFSFHGRSGPGSAASQSAIAFAFISRSISA